MRGRGAKGKKREVVVTVRGTKGEGGSNEMKRSKG